MRRRFKRITSIVTYIIAVAMLFTCSFFQPTVGFAKETNSASYYAGMAKMDLSPTQEQLDTKTIFMGGYGSYMTRGPAEGVSDNRIYARALALKSGSESIVYLTIDTTVIGNEVLDAIQKGAADLTGIPEDHIMISATHTHAGPDVNGLWGGVSAEYKQYFIKQSIRAVEDAAENMKHVTITTGSTQVPQELVKNRRGLGYTDRDMEVLQFRAGKEMVATLVNFAVHPVVLREDNKLLSSDFVGSLERNLEAQYGGTAMFINGAQGDVEPNVDWNVDVPAQYELAKNYGDSISFYVSEAILKSKEVSQGISIKTTNVTFPVQNPAFLYANRLGWFNGYFDMRQDGKNYYVDSKISRITLGKGANTVEMVTLPGEALTNLGLDIRKMMPGKHKMLLGLTQDTLGYLIPENEWNGSEYEEQVSLGIQTGEIVRQAIQGLY